jgi:hypothetical protein
LCSWWCGFLAFIKALLAFRTSAFLGQILILLQCSVEEMYFVFLEDIIIEDTLISVFDLD